MRITGAHPHSLTDVTVNHSSDVTVFAECNTKCVPVSAFQNWIDSHFAFTPWNVALRSPLSECNLKGLR